MKKKILTTLIFLGFIILISACSFNFDEQDSSNLSIDPVFLELYEYLGGIDLLGAPITNTYQENGLDFQYTENSLMYRDAEKNLGLFPLSENLKIHQAPPGDYHPQENDLIIDGYPIHPAFVNLYQSLMGGQYTGKPRTGPITDFENNRLEQYFENVAFYMELDDPKLEAKMLPLGTMACDDLCQSVYNSQSDPAENLPKPFSKAVTELGSDFLGQVISEPYVISDGSTELIFENVVLFSNDGSSKYQLRPIVGLLGYAAQEPTTEVINEYLVFVEIENGLGHNIPLFINDYIEEHGGLDISGLPITEFALLGDNVSHQCFTNLCVEFYADAPQDLQLVPAMLGRKYQQLVFGDTELFIEDSNPTVTTPVTQSSLTPAVELPQGIADIDKPMLITSETYALLSADDSQTIFVSIYDDNIGVESATPYIEINFPNDTSVIYIFEPTDAEGQTEIHLDPISGASGSLVDYKVCLNLIEEEPICVSENFLIWNP